MDTVSGIQSPSWQQTVSEPELVEKTRLWAWHGVCFLRRFMSRESSMAVEASKAAALKNSAAAPKQSFGDVLKKAPEAPRSAGQLPPPLPKTAKAVGLKAVHSPAVVAQPAAPTQNAAPRPQGAVASPESLAAARTQMNARTTQLAEARTHALATQEQKVDTRLLELIVKELTIEFTAEERSGHPTLDAASQKRGAATDAAALAVAPVSSRSSEGFGQIAQKLEIAQTQASAKAQAAMALVEKIEAFVKAQRPALALTVSGAINARVEVERTGPNEVALKVSGTRGPPPPEDVARIREAVRARGLKLSSLSIG